VPTTASPDPLELDPLTAERLLNGAVGADDAPPGYQAVVATLAAVRQPGTAAELAGEAAAVAGFRAARGVSAGRSTHGLARRVAAPVLVASVLFVGAGAAAATGSLPASWQRTAHDALAHIGIDVPGGAQASHGGTATTTSTGGSTTTSTPHRPTTSTTTHAPPPHGTDNGKGNAGQPGNGGQLGNGGNGQHLGNGTDNGKGNAGQPGNGGQLGNGGAGSGQQGNGGGDQHGGGGNQQGDGGGNQQGNG
jgi:hypothetical protein